MTFYLKNCNFMVSMLVAHVCLKTTCEIESKL
nr:unnamed protein product [Callosobruchus chinensis]